MVTPKLFVIYDFSMVSIYICLKKSFILYYRFPHPSRLFNGSGWDVSVFPHPSLFLYYFELFKLVFPHPSYSCERRNFLQAFTKHVRFGFILTSWGRFVMLHGPLHRKLFKYLVDAFAGRFGTYLFLVP